jgi:anti-anti-sigma factor
LNIETTVDGTRTCLRLDGDLTVDCVTSAKHDLLAALGQHTEVELDLSAVDEIDSAGMQLLVLLLREARALDKTLRLGPCSTAVARLIALFGLSAQLDLPAGAAVC